MTIRYRVLCMLLLVEKAAAMSDKDYQKFLAESLKAAQESEARLNAGRKKAVECGQSLEHLTDKGQYDTSYNPKDKNTRMSVSCGGIALMAANAFEQVGLAGLKSIDLDAVLRAGNAFYQRFLKNNPKREPGLLLLSEVVKQAKQEEASLMLKRDAFGVAIPVNPSINFILDYLEKKDNNAYVLLTFSNQTVMIGFDLKSGSFVFFDSHRKDNQAKEGSETPGAGYHVFPDKKSLLCYLTNYPSLGQQIDMELFVPKKKESCAAAACAVAPDARLVQEREDRALAEKLVQEEADSNIARRLEEEDQGKALAEKLEREQAETAAAQIVAGEGTGQNSVVKAVMQESLRGLKFKN